MIIVQQTCKGVENWSLNLDFVVLNRRNLDSVLFVTCTLASILRPIAGFEIHRIG